MAAKSKTAMGLKFQGGKPKKTRQGSSKNSRPKQNAKRYRGRVVLNFSHHELKLIFTAVRRYQRNMTGNPLYADDYVTLGRILTALQPVAHGISYLSTADGSAHPRQLAQDQDCARGCG